MTDRDTFAAAALTGLLYPEVDDEFAMPYIVGRAYLWADAMLRERAKTNHDAAPAATAQDLGTGDTTKPIKGGVSDRSKPINGPDPDSRVWETPVHTPAPHATPGEGSEQRECTEPVAWAVRYRHGDTGIVDLCRTLADCRAKWSNRTRRISGGAAVRCIRWFAGVGLMTNDGMAEAEDHRGHGTDRV